MAVEFSEYSKKNINTNKLLVRRYDGECIGRIIKLKDCDARLVSAHNCTASDLRAIADKLDSLNGVGDD